MRMPCSPGYSATGQKNATVRFAGVAVSTLSVDEVRTISASP